MIQTKQARHRDEAKARFIEEMLARGWALNRFGHLHKDLNAVYRGEPCVLKHRLKFLNWVCRFEVQLDANWHVKTRCDFRSIKFNEDGSISFNKVKFKPIKKVEL